MPPKRAPESPRKPRTLALESADRAAALLSSPAARMRIGAGEAAAANEQPGSATESASSSATSDEKERRRKAIKAWLLIAANGLFCFGSFVGKSSEMEVWLLHYAGDFAANGRTQATLQSVGGLVSLFSQPIIGSITDAVGRRPVMIFAQVATLLRCLITACSPTPALIACGEVLKEICMGTWCDLCSPI